MKLNPDKMEVLFVGHNLCSDSGITPVLNQVALPLKAQVRGLGALLESSLLWILRCRER